MKSLLNIRNIYKISSSRLSESDWNLSLTKNEAVVNNEMIGLASSTAIRMIDKLNGNDDIDNKITELKTNVKRLKRVVSKNNEEIIEFRSKLNELANTVFVKDIVFVVMNSKKDYYRANKGFKINGIEYERLLATSGGIKKFTIIYVNKEIKKDLYKWLNNDRDLTQQFVPAKLEAYISLAFSSSIPVSVPKGIVVVNDVETTFTDSVILIDGTETIPTMRIDDNYKKTLNASDGFGLISPELAYKWGTELQEDYTTSGFCLRWAFLKGMVFTFPFKEFAEEVAKTNYITDVWGEVHDIRDTELIITTSMLKLWQSYASIGQYIDSCNINNFEMSVTKMIDEELNNEQTMNYQFLQSLNLSDEDIYNLCKPTIDEFHDVLGGDYRKSLLFLRGCKMNVDNVINNMDDFTSAIMVDEEILNDKYVHSKIRNSIKTMIDRAKMGVIKANGNFQIIGGDPYILCESMFGLNPEGLLKRGEFYSNYWNERNVKEVACFRSPMVVENNSLVRKLACTNEMQKWYRYIKNAVLFNAWDCSCDSLAGADFDSDQLFTTDNKYVIGGIDVKLKPIVCIQGSASKRTPKEKDFIEANIIGAGSKVGSYTNIASTMESLKSCFKEGSKEYNELKKRLIFSIFYQQADIDASKGIRAVPMPKEWSDWKVNETNETDTEEEKQRKEFNKKILANKKPYYFIYNYEQLKSEFNKFHRDSEDISIMKYGKTINDLLYGESLTEDEVVFIENYKEKCPVGITNSVINKIARIFENEFGANKKTKIVGYDSNKLKTNKPYSDEDYENVLKLKKEFSKSSKLSIKKMMFDNHTTAKGGVDNIIVSREMIYSFYKDKILSLGINGEDLCNIMVDICYKDDNSKKLVWLVCGKLIIKNMMNNTGNKIKFPSKSKDGEIEYCGNKFELIEVGMNEICL